MDDKKKTMKEDVSTAKSDEESKKTGTVKEGKAEESQKEEITKEERIEESKIEETVKERKTEESQEMETAKEGKAEESQEMETAKEGKAEESQKNELVEEKKEDKSEKRESAKEEITKEVGRKEPIREEKTENIVQSGKKSRKPLVACLSIAAIFLIAYIAGVLYFSGHFYQKAEINGIPVSNMDASTARQALDAFYKNYTLSLETIDGEKIVIVGKDISMQIKLHDGFKACLKQQKAYLWFVNMLKYHNYVVDADVAWDEDALSDFFDSMKILNEKEMTAPQDAYVGIEDGKLTIVKEVLGNKIITGTFKKMVRESLLKVQSALVLADAGCYSLPKVYDTDEELKKELEEKSEFINSEIKLQLDDLTLEPGMELYDAVLEKKGNSFEVSKTLVEKYVASLAEQYDTLGTDRMFTTSFNDKKIETYGTAFGYKMNQEKTVEALYKALTGGKSTTVEVSFDEKGYTLQGENDIGDTYVEVNLSEQRVIAYKDGKKIAEGDCVSGNESAGNGTCIGLYAIQNKLSPTVLRGEKKPVTKTVTKKKKGKKVKETVTTYEYEYESPVTFWMQFNGGIGLHDAAQWRSAYGGSIYYYSGSHGCVNLPYDLAETLYKNFEIGDPVIVYFWDNENRK